MTKHKYYSVELKIQIVERYLRGASAASLRKEFQISSSGTLYTCDVMSITWTKINKT
ncbi:transposase [Listeria ivanovii]|uniref:transposase n=1 Tax=Listeria ivanovii TaxID=1638 RepID=UPI001625DC09|nr:transposase [Listeria ivanovii]MBC2253994.1 transposase [Listeria ivanovii]